MAAAGQAPVLEVEVPCAARVVDVWAARVAGGRVASMFVRGVALTVDVVAAGSIPLPGGGCLYRRSSMPPPTQTPSHCVLLLCILSSLAHAAATPPHVHR